MTTIDLNTYRRTSGSLAVDFGYVPGSAVPKPEPVTAPPVRREQQQEKAAPHRNAKRKKRTGVSLTTLFCFAVVMVLVVTLISGYTKMIELSDSTVELRSQLSELQQEHTALKTKYESEIDLKEIERYAVYELGMVMPSADHIVYVDLSEPDKAVVGDDTQTAAAAQTDSGMSWFEKMVEYFK